MKKRSGGVGDERSIVGSEKPLLDSEIHGMCRWVGSRLKLKAVSTGHETRCAEIENIPAGRSLSAVVAKIVIGISVARRLDRPGISRDICHGGCVHNNGGRGNVVSIRVAQVKLDGEGRTAIDRSRLVVQGANAIRDLPREGGAAGLEVFVPTVGSLQRMPTDKAVVEP